MHAVFFDVDGTLFDTRADLAATVNHTRRDLGFPELPVETVITHVGQGARYLLEHAIPEAKVPYEQLWEIFRSHYAEHCCETVVPYPNVRRTLDELKDRGWKLGINTNKPNFAVKLILEKFGFARYFGAAVVAGGDGVPLKPDAQSAAQRLQVHRENKSLRRATSALESRGVNMVKYPLISQLKGRIKNEDDMAAL